MSHKYTGHAPGPWEVSNLSGGRRIFDARGCEVAYVWRPDGPSPFHVGPNAYLIADAPTLLRQRDELLAALKDLLRDMETPRTAKASAAWDRARAVVAKAEGK